jgi:flagellar biosynthesis protein FliR
MESEGSSCSQEPATGLYSELTNVAHNFPQYYLRFILILSSLQRLVPRIDLFPPGFPIEILYAFVIYSMRAICPAHLIFFYSITPTILLSLKRIFKDFHKYQMVNSHKRIYWTLT